MNTHRIQQLSANLINQIAAGEVVARPASAFKECIENSLDAGATKIEIILIDGGLKLIEIRDNGKGIAKDDLPLAITRHATSKIASLSDLEQVGSFGFRGEALAAISSVSNFEIISAEEQNTAWRLVFNPVDYEQKILPHAYPQGTCVIIRDLFFNTPARRKFLRTSRTEYSYIEKSFRYIALAFSHISFKLVHNDKVIWDLHTEDFASRCKNIMGSEFVEKSFVVSSQSGNWTLRGFVGSPHIAKNNANSQYFFVNNRAVSDKVITHAIKQAYSDIMYGNKQPVFVLFLDMPTNEVDVNVHPTKKEVRFRQSNQIHSFIYASLKRELSQPLATNEQNRRLLQASQDSVEQEYKRQVDLQDLDNRNLNTDFNQSFVQVNADFKQKSSLHTDKPALNAKTFFDEDALLQEYEKLPEINSAKNVNLDTAQAKFQGKNLELFLPLPTNENAISEQKADKLDFAESEQISFMHNDMQIPPMGVALAQIKNTFILSESKQGLLIIDMHAAHERIVYEDMKQQLATQNLKNQKLLFPLQLAVDDALLETAEQNKDLLVKLGLELQIENSNILICSFPSLLQQELALQMVEEVLQELHNYKTASTWQNSMERCLASMACQGAWRSGKKLSIDQMNHLLRRMEQTPNSDTCCHGRLTWKEFSLKELNAFFKRGQ